MVVVVVVASYYSAGGSCCGSGDYCSGAGADGVSGGGGGGGGGDDCLDADADANASGGDGDGCLWSEFLRPQMASLQPQISALLKLPANYDSPVNFLIVKRKQCHEGKYKMRPMVLTARTL